MSWTFDGSNRIIFSGTQGPQEYAAVKAAAGAFALPLPPQFNGDKAQRFLANGFVFVLQPML